MKTLSHLALSFVAAAALVACAAEPAPDSAEVSQGLTCSPGAEMCDFGCYYQGGPSSDDCIVKCNASGTAWTTIQSCGWAQNFPYSSSCLDAQPHPICKNN